MSEFSLDSLESSRERSLIDKRCDISLNENNDDFITTGNKFRDCKSGSSNSENPTTFLPPIKDTEPNESSQGRNIDRNRKVRRTKNAIIANASSKSTNPRQESPCTRIKRLHVVERRLPERKGNIEEEANAGVLKREEFPPKTSTTRHSNLLRGSLVGNYYDNDKDDEIFMKPDKKLSNVLVPRVQRTRNPGSYLELYRQRFSVPQYRRIRSPEGSTLSIFGDSERERLTESGSGVGFTSTSSRDGRTSELSFYRHLIEEPIQGVPCTTRSYDSLRRDCTTVNSSTFLKQDSFKRSASEGRLQKKPSYRPYTIQDYRCLTIPKPDRSLGPDETELQTKREWLMRRRLYGDLVSARNCQRILFRDRKLKSKRIVAQKCLPPCAPKDVSPMDREDKVESQVVPVWRNVGQKDRTGCPSGSMKLTVVASNAATCSGKFKVPEKSRSLRSYRKSSELVEDSYLESLRQRHFREKELVDRIVSQMLTCG